MAKSAAPTVEGIGVVPKEALRFLKNKTDKVSFRWQNVYAEEHAASFTVAGMTKAELLAEVHKSLEDAIEKGVTFRSWRDAIRPSLAKAGWLGSVKLVNPDDPTDVRTTYVGNRRLKLIYDCNLRSAYAAGQWERAERTKLALPYLIYELGPSKEHRPEHVSWAGTILPVDDAWWSSHMPPNGWKCKCRVRQITRAEAAKKGYDAEKRPPLEGKTVAYQDKVNNVTRQVPVGIDPGWEGNPGKARLRAITPQMLDDPSNVAQAILPVGPMPTPRLASADRLMPPGLAQEEYVTAFLKEFGTEIGKPAVHEDVVGEPLVVTEELFKNRFGGWKVLKQGRERFMLMLADTIKSPDEIWTAFQKMPDGRTELRRRYLAQWTVQGETLPMLTVFEWGKSGWSGVTAFDPETVSYLMRQRQGKRAYVRKSG